MSSASIPATVQIRRSRLVGLIGVAAALAAAISWVALSFTADGGSASRPASALPAAASSPLQDAARDRSIMSLTPAQLAAGALGTGYQLPIARTGPTTASILASMSPQTRRYTRAVMGLTFAQLAAGAAGHP
jgi:hypothetical protein